MSEPELLKNVPQYLKEHYFESDVNNYLSISGAKRDTFTEPIKEELLRLYEEIGSQPIYGYISVGDYRNIRLQIDKRILEFINIKRYDMLIKDGFEREALNNMCFSSTNVVSDMRLRTYLRFDPSVIKKLYLDQNYFTYHVNQLEKMGLCFQKDYYNKPVQEILGRYVSSLTRIGDIAALTYEQFCELVGDPLRAQEICNTLQYKPFQFADASVDGEVDDIDYDEELARVNIMISKLEEIKKIKKDVEELNKRSRFLEGEFFFGVCNSFPFDVLVDLGPYDIVR